MEPTASPSGPISIDAPGGRGADWKVATTVPIPTVSPAFHQPISSSSTSRMGDYLHQICERCQRVTGYERVNMGERRGHSLLYGLVADQPPVRIHPDDPVRQPV